MSTTPTTYYAWQKPDIASEIDTWGARLNTIFDDVDADLKTVSDQAAAAVPAAAPTGAVQDFFLAAAPAGWLELNGTTIGSAASGATYANAAAQALFLALWTAGDNTACPVSGGRGASAAADWAANKTLTLPNMAGRFRRTVGGNAAAIGIAQDDAMQDFKMTFTIGPSNSGGGQTWISTHSDIGSTSTQTLNPAADSAGAPRLDQETRPVNIAFRTCIKL